jgi:hypothetical protein
MAHREAEGAGKDKFIFYLPLAVGQQNKLRLCWLHKNLKT